MKRILLKPFSMVTGLSPCLALRRDVPFQAQTFHRYRPQHPVLTLQLHSVNYGFRDGLFSVRSPLLGESLTVSIPVVT
jgi:hypothetical protein